MDSLVEFWKVVLWDIEDEYINETDGFESYDIAKLVAEALLKMVPEAEYVSIEKYYRLPDEVQNEKDIKMIYFESWIEDDEETEE